MEKRIFTVTFKPEDGPSISYLVHAPCEQTAAHQARMFAGLPAFPFRQMEIHPNQDISDSDEDAVPPYRGWIINGYSLDGRVLEKQFLVATEEISDAVAIVERRIGSNLVMQAGPEVHQDHLLRRKMCRGEIFELGSQHIGRGKNIKPK